MAGRPPARGERNPAVILDAIRELFTGRSNAGGSVTLTAGVTTTVVSGPNIGNESGIFLFPKTANAAAAVPTTYVLQVDVVRGQFTITHANAGTTDRTFWWIAIG